MIKKVVIVGGGFSGWYLAASLRHKYPDISITVIDSERFARLGVGEYWLTDGNGSGLYKGHIQKHYIRINK